MRDHGPVRSRIPSIAALGLVALAGCSTPAPPPPAPPGFLEGTVTVFAAASLTEVFDSLEPTFETAYPGVDLVLDYGGSSGLAAQIIEGAPADVFAAADEATMQTVVDAGHALEPEIFTANRLELVVPAGNPGGVTGLADLADPDLAIALCDAAVPCGAAAQALLAAAGITARPDTLEQDVKAVLTKVELGEADAGLVYRTDVVAAGGAVEGIEVPEAADIVNRYPIAIVSGTPNGTGAHAWVEYVLSDTGRQALAAAGFVTP
ncbi:MAG: molybdate ABC transporter substrate-binding protein [Microbacteriaceae bacterium]|nr:molybdate ABC transporter substrate-binding protein [Microbacteriaceae bacterium]